MPQNSELSLLKTIIKTTKSERLVPVQNGDDAAVIRMGSELIAITTDNVVEGHHYSFDYFSSKQVGIKAVESSVSDLVAIGAEPQGIVIALSMPASTSTNLVAAIYEGIYDACTRTHIELLGGDITGNDAGVEIAVTAIGLVKNESDILRRSTAKVGDLLCVTGDLGGSMAGLRAIQAGLINCDNAKLKHLEPRCRIDLVGKLSGVNAAIDISDGLSSELHHICRNSKCGALVKADLIPVSSDSKSVANELNESYLEYALNGGEDYELLLSVPRELYRKELGVIIGECTATNAVLIEQNGSVCPLVSHGYDHLKME